MKNNIYYYDGSRNAVIMMDMDGKELVIDYDEAEAPVVFDEPEDIGILARMAREEPVNYMSNAMPSGWIAGLCGCVK